MNEQELAELLSEQIDAMLQGNPVDNASGPEEVSGLLELGQHLGQLSFQPSAAAQTTFQTQLAAWSGIPHGGSVMTVLGLSKFWFFSLLIVSLVVVGGGGFFLAVVLMGTGSSGTSQLPPTATETATESTTETATSAPTSTVNAATETATPIATETVTVTLTATQPISDTPTPQMATATVVASETATGTVTTTETPTAIVTATPDLSPTPTAITTPETETPTIIFVNNLIVPSLCAGVYTTQSTLINYGSSPISGSALVWDVIEGQEFVSNINIQSNSFIQTVTDSETTSVSSSSSTTIQTSFTETGGDVVSPTLTSMINYAHLSEISVDQTLDLDIGVEVNETWWTQPDGTQIKVKLVVSNQIQVSSNVELEDEDSDDNRGHGNDEDGYDEDNPGRGRGRHNIEGYDDGQIITIVKQGAQWVTLSGAVHYYQTQSLLVGGNIIVLNDCSAIPASMPPGSTAEVTGILQPDGTFIAINISIININIFIGDFESGALSYDGDSSDDDDDQKGSKKKSSKKKSSKKKSSKKGS